ncbi:MAG: hypothetical protein QXF82_05700 [Nitrososphaeria archaeon]
MKNLKWKFYVTTNNNTYYATSLKAIASFCRKNDFVLSDYYTYLPLICEKKQMSKCGWGVWGIPDNNNYLL